jgi:Coenzyme PQQ synthesis protein D (PqqD)
MLTQSTTPSVRAVELDDTIARGPAMVEHVGSEIALIDLTTHRVSTLNATGAMIWDQLSEPCTVRVCAEAVAAATATPFDRVAQDTQEFVTALLRRGLLIRT